jgi:hypothetical protein
MQAVPVGSQVFTDQVLSSAALLAALKQDKSTSSHACWFRLSSQLALLSTPSQPNLTATEDVQPPVPSWLRAVKLPPPSRESATRKRTPSVPVPLSCPRQPSGPQVMHPRALSRGGSGWRRLARFWQSGRPEDLPRAAASASQSPQRCTSVTACVTRRRRS